MECQMAVYGYVRVSTDRQADEGESLGAQQRTIEGYALMLGVRVDHVFVERGVSGSKPLRDRPEGAKLLRTIKFGDWVITPKLDRMFRSSLDAISTLTEMRDVVGIHLHMIDLGGDVTGNGISKLVFTILSAVAEAERDRIRERISDVKRDQKARGRYLGGTVPFGYGIEIANGGVPVLAPLEGEQSAIQKALEMSAGGASLRKIAAALKADGYAISHAAVQRVLRDARPTPVKRR
jgi:DNA invertase Pin-like site-specific DNA recombinase